MAGIVVNVNFDRARMANMAEQQKLSVNTIQDILRQLEEARREIIGRIASLPEGSYSAVQATHMRDEIDRVMREWTGQADRTVQEGQSKSFALGQEMADAPMAAAGISPMLGRLDRTQLEVAQAHVLPELRGISSDASRRILAALRQAQTGSKSLAQTISQIGRAVTGGETPSFFSEAGQRAARIAHHELHEIAGQAMQKRLTQYADRMKEIRPGATLPGYKPPSGTRQMPAKEWRHTPQEHPRLGHVQLNGTVVAVNEPFTNPDTGEDLMYPHDADADISETINCKCFVLPAFLDEAA